MAAVQLQPRAHYNRPSPFSSQYAAFTASSNRCVNVSDSDSDDEPPPAIKFSKATEALLNNKSPPVKQEAKQALRSISHAELETPSRPAALRVLRKSSPSAFSSVERRGSTPPRIVHIGAAQGSARRTVSIAGPYPPIAHVRRDTTPRIDRHEMSTPAQPQGRARAGSNASQDGLAGKMSSSRPTSRNGATSDPPEPRASTTSTSKAAMDAKYASLTAAKTRNLTSEMPHASQRIKRAPITGSLLKSAPVRRARRRESEENVSPVDEYGSAGQSQPSSGYTPQESSGRSRGDSINTRATSVEPVSVHDFAQDKDTRPDSRQHHALASRPASRQSSHEQIRPRIGSAERPRPAASSVDIKPAESYKLPHRHAASQSYKHVSSHDGVDDQENAPPPTFKRNKAQEFKYLGKPAVAILSDDEKHDEYRPAPLQPDRKVLGAISSNTPMRAAPPPPKMTVLDVATTTAGAATTKSRKKRTHIVVNGKIFTQMGKIGKGGSSEVFCVMAENYKTFAMKKVKLDDCDETAVRGYKGEIDLLKKLTEVDRVIRLFDWELNNDKQELLVLMEKGDTDLNRVLTMKISGQGATLDAAFTRYHWKEMLECVQAVHEHDIVHSDLKPANFLVVQGRLKLIDFGIANAIDTDNTCNVHRDSHVGTPNYMSPESITDTNASGPGLMNSRDAQGRPLKKDMKIGKSSDVWSLGCILYQMTYGRPPFAHIVNQISRIMAITNPNHVIEFPDTGIGGVRVPSSLKGILKRCLQRDVKLRPTIPQLLSDHDTFLNPESDGAVMIKQDVLDQIINRVVSRCREPRGLPPASEVAQYAASFMAKIREMNEKV